MPELKTDDRMIHLHFARGDAVTDEVVLASEVESFLTRHVDRADEISDALLFLEVGRMASGRFVGDFYRRRSVMKHDTEHRSVARTNDIMQRAKRLIKAAPSRRH